MIMIRVKCDSFDSEFLQFIQQLSVYDLVSPKLRSVTLRMT